MSSSRNLSSPLQPAQKERSMQEASEKKRMEEKQQKMKQDQEELLTRKKREFEQKEKLQLERRQQLLDGTLSKELENEFNDLAKMISNSGNRVSSLDPIDELTAQLARDNNFY